MTIGNLPRLSAEGWDTLCPVKEPNVEAIQLVEVDLK